MWDKESDIFEALEEHDFDFESTDVFFDTEFDSDTVQGIEEDTFDKDTAQFDYED